VIVKLVLLVLLLLMIAGAVHFAGAGCAARAVVGAPRR
jgi:hypothetical protein